MLITNGKIITWEEENRVLDGYAIYIDGDVIGEVGLEAKLKAKYPDDEKLDAARPVHNARKYLRAHPFLWRLCPGDGDPWSSSS